MKTFHFCAQYQKTPGQVNYYDGFIEIGNDFDFFARSQEIRMWIADSATPAVENAKAICILSLTLVSA